MIKSSSSIKNLWLSKSAHLNALLVNGFVSKRVKATALSLVENLDESANGNGLNGGSGKDSKATTALKGNSGENDTSNNTTTNLTEAKQQTYYNNTVWLDDRSKYGHTGKELQEKIATEVSDEATRLLLQRSCTSCTSCN